MDQRSFDWVSELVLSVSLKSGQTAKVWPWPPRAPKISSIFPWLASFFVPPFFPLNEDTFLPTLATHHHLDGIAGDLSITAKAARNGREGCFFRFGMDQKMKDSLEERRYTLRFSIHKVFLFVTANRLHPDFEVLIKHCLLYTSPSPRDRG